MDEIEEFIKISKMTVNEPRIKIKLKRLEKEEEKKKNKLRKDKEDKYKDIFNIECISTFDYNNNNIHRKFEFKDEDILVNGLDSKSQGFIYLINELTTEDYSMINNNKNNNSFINI